MANFRFGSNDYTVNIRTQHSASLLQAGAYTALSWASR